MANVYRGKPYQLDKNMNPIQGFDSIMDIMNVAVTSGAWATVQLSDLIPLSGCTRACKQVRAKLRDGTPWRISHLSAGTRYMTVVSDITIDLVQHKTAVLFYAQSVAASGTLEVMLLD